LIAAIEMFVVSAELAPTAGSPVIEVTRCVLTVSCAVPLAARSFATARSSADKPLAEPDTSEAELPEVPAATSPLTDISPGEAVLCAVSPDDAPCASAEIEVAPRVPERSPAMLAPASLVVELSELCVVEVPAEAEMLDESLTVSERPLDAESAERSFDNAAARSSASRRRFSGSFEVALDEVLLAGVEFDAVLPLDAVSDDAEPVCAVSVLAEDVDFGGSGFVLLLDE
jgi:hypothetical protein